MTSLPSHMLVHLTVLCVCAQYLSCVQLFVTHQAPLSMEFFR